MEGFFHSQIAAARALKLRPVVDCDDQFQDRVGSPAWPAEENQMAQLLGGNEHLPPALALRGDVTASGFSRKNPVRIGGGVHSKPTVSCVPNRR